MSETTMEMFLKSEKFYSKAKEYEGGHWTNETIDNRWFYHLQTINLIKKLGIKDPTKVLEMGTMGMSCVNGGNTIDYAESWDFPGKKPTYLYDARKTPWPIEDKKYDLFIALRVFMHLSPSQKECIKETRRIAKKVIIVVPNEYSNSVFPDSRGITYNDFVEYLNGIHPNIYVPNKNQDFYFWDTENPSYIDIMDLMQTQIEIGDSIPELNPKPHLISRARQKIKRMIGG